MIGVRDLRACCRFSVAKVPIVACDVAIWVVGVGIEVDRKRNCAGSRRGGDADLWRLIAGTECRVSGARVWIAEFGVDDAGVWLAHLWIDDALIVRPEAGGLVAGGLIAAAL